MPKRAGLAVTAALAIGGVTAAIGIQATGGAAHFTDIMGVGISGSATADGTDGADGPKPLPKQHLLEGLTDARPGSCLTWDTGSEAQLKDLATVPCSRPHLFETTARINVDDVAGWADVFATQDSVPTDEQVQQLRAEMCVPAADTYLEGKFNPAGRLVVSQVLPPAGDWLGGDRTLLCGLQVDDPEGDGVIPAEGLAEKMDQAILRQPGECTAIDDDNQLVTVGCDEQHVLESTGAVDLAGEFPGTAPSVDEQNAKLAERCAVMATDYLGAEDALFRTQLLPFWFTVDPKLYPNTRSVNCWIAASADGGSLATLVGSVTGDYTVNGQQPQGK